VQWTPPSDASELVGYQVFMTSDEAGSNRVRLWHSSDSQGPTPVFPVGTNRFTLHNPTERKTTSPTHPANWIMVFTESAGGLQSADKAAAVRLYDESGGPPSTPNLKFLGMLDQDDRDGYVRGIIVWSPQDNIDFGFTTEYKVYLAEDDAGKGEVAVGTAPVGTNLLSIPDSVACWQRSHLLIYASNPSGRTVQPASKVLDGCAAGGVGRRLMTADVISQGAQGHAMRPRAILPWVHTARTRNTTNLLARLSKPCRQNGGCVLV